MPPIDLRMEILSLRRLHAEEGPAAVLAELRKRTVIDGDDLAFVIDLLQKSQARGAKSRKLERKKRLTGPDRSPEARKQAIVAAAYMVAALRDSGLTKAKALQRVAAMTPDANGRAMSPATIEKRIQGILVRRSGIRWTVASMLTDALPNARRRGG